MSALCGLNKLIYTVMKILTTETNLFFQVLASQMKHYTESRDIDKITRLQGEVSDVKDILVKNIGKLKLPCVFFHIMRLWK